MKTCPFCAEEILDAAIVCKHCGRDLVQKAAAVVIAPTKARSRRWPWILAAVLVIGYFLVQASRADYLAFDQRREDWHRRCDVYVGSTATGASAAAIACKQELDEMIAYATRKGWQ